MDYKNPDSKVTYYDLPKDVGISLEQIKKFLGVETLDGFYYVEPVIITIDYTYVDKGV